MKRKSIIIAMCVLLVVALCGCSKSPLSAKDPVAITVWNYYSGDQQTAFEDMVQKFNDGVGKDEGIIVESVNQGDINNLADALLDSESGKAGSADLPDLAAVYSETAYILAKDDKLVDLDEYFSSKELDAYIPEFIEEGRLEEGGPLYIMPVSKSTEVFMANTTDWAPFEAATGVTIDSITTMEDMATAAQKYYDYTDGLTPDVPEDGKALYGRDSLGNYLIVGSKQLDHPFFTVKDGKVEQDFDRDTMKQLWDNYYVPYINGYYGSYGKFRSEDAKTGRILAMTCASTGASYFPTTVTMSDESTHDIECTTKKALGLKNQKNDVTVQQGAGYCLLKSDDKRQYAAAEFLKWFTDTDQNVAFSVDAGYSPVKVDANQEDTIKSAFKDTGKTGTKAENTQDAILISADCFTNNGGYTSKPFDGSKNARYTMEDAFEKVCADDRAAVEAQIAAGSSRKDAVAKYTTEAYFDQWFDGFKKEVQAVVK